MALLVVSFTNCSKDDESATGFSSEEQKALQVLDGTFVCEETLGGKVLSTETFVFSPFVVPTSKKSTMNDVPINFCGIIKHYYEGSIDNVAEYYFYLNTSEKQIIANATHSTKNDYFNALVEKKWDYKIIDNNTIQLFDTELSNPLTQTKMYIRQ